MTRQLISTNKQPLLRSSHAKRPPQNGFVQVAKPDMFVPVPTWTIDTAFTRTSGLLVSEPGLLLVIEIRGAELLRQHPLLFPTAHHLQRNQDRKN